MFNIFNIVFSFLIHKSCNEGKCNLKIKKNDFLSLKTNCTEPCNFDCGLCKE